MDLYEIRQMLRKGVPISDIALRVTYYTRVSTESEEQMNSLKNQTQYYDEFIRNNSNWTYVPGYIDEGLTGVTTKKRERFNDMMDDAAAGMFDLIVTKEVSRFARNTMDSLTHTRSLLSQDVGVFFHEQGINTLSEEGELRLTIMAALAQEESQRLSQRVKFGHAQSIKNNVVHGNSLIYGYKKDNKKLVIDESQAPMVRMLYGMYSSDTYSLKSLSKILYNKGYANRNGKPISHNTLSGIIANPKYKGYYCGNKVKIIDMFTKKQKFLPEEEWRMFKDESGEIVPAIVNEDVWNRANEVLKRRSADVVGGKNQANRTNVFTGKLYCQHCGVNFYRKDSATKVKTWVCSGKIKNLSDSCPTFPIYEEELCEILIKMLTGDAAKIDERIRRYEEVFRTANAASDHAKQLESITAQINIVRRKSNKALELNIDGKISDDAFSRLSADCDAELSALQEQYNSVEAEQRAYANMGNEIASMRALLIQASKDAAQGLVNRPFVNKYISRIYVTMEGDIMHLDVAFGNMGERVHAEYQRRPGSTIKKMIPGQRSKFVRRLRSVNGHAETREYEAKIAVF